MKADSNKTLSVLMLLAGSLLIGFSFGRWLAPLAAWIGPILLIRYARDHKRRRDFFLVIAALILAFVIGFGQIWEHFGGLPAIVSFGIFYGILWSLPYLADRWMSRRLRGFSSTFVYPLAATTLELLYIRTSPLGAWGVTGFTQYGNLALMQLASVTGMIGITFLMGWFAAIANWAWENRGRGDEIFRGAGVYGMVLAIVLVFGYLRLGLAPTSEIDETVRVAGITARGLDTLYDRIKVVDSEDSRLVVQSHWDAFFEETTREAQAGARVIVWSELSGPTIPMDQASHIAQAQEVARQNRIYLTVPLGIHDPDTGQRTVNKLLLIDPGGAIVLEHVKYGGHIIEGTLLGDKKLKTVDTPFGVISSVICYDADYPSVIQQSGQNGTGLFLVPSSDWFTIDPVHGQMAVFRAIENGMSLVRQTNAGLSIAVDAYGRVLAQTDYFGATDRTMVAQVPARHVATLYTAFGRYLDWLFLAGFLAIVVRAVVARKAVG